MVLVYSTTHIPNALNRRGLYLWYKDFDENVTIRLWSLKSHDDIIMPDHVRNPKWLILAGSCGDTYFAWTQQYPTQDRVLPLFQFQLEARLGGTWTRLCLTFTVLVSGQNVGFRENWVLG